MKLMQWMAFGLIMLIIVEVLIVPDAADAWGRRRRSSRRRRSWFRSAVSTVGRGLAKAGTAIRNGLDSTVGRGLLFGVGLVNGIVGPACCTGGLAVPFVGVACCGITRGIAGGLCVAGTSNTEKSISRGDKVASTLGAAGTVSSCLQAATGLGTFGHLRALAASRGKRAATKAQCKTTLFSDSARLKMHICTLAELRVICHKKTRKTRRGNVVSKAIRAAKSLLAVIAHTNRRRSLYKLLASTTCKKVDLLPTCHPSKLEMMTAMKMKPLAENLGYDPLSQPCRYVRSNEKELSARTCVFRESYAFSHLARELGLLTSDVIAAYPTAVRKPKRAKKAEA